MNQYYIILTFVYKKLVVTNSILCIFLSRNRVFCVYAISQCVYLCECSRDAFVFVDKMLQKFRKFKSNKLSQILGDREIIIQCVRFFQFFDFPHNHIETGNLKKNCFAV